MLEMEEEEVDDSHKHSKLELLLPKVELVKLDDDKEEDELLLELDQLAKVDKLLLEEEDELLPELDEDEDELLLDDEEKDEKGDELLLELDEKDDGEEGEVLELDEGPDEEEDELDELSQRHADTSVVSRCLCQGPSQAKETSLTESSTLQFISAWQSQISVSVRTANVVDWTRS